MIVVAVTNVDWFMALRGNPHKHAVNFWRPGSARFAALKPGEKFYFLLSSPIRKIGGYGTFEKYDRMPLSDAWDEFGTGNGVHSLQEFRDRMGSFSTTVPGAAAFDPEIGCINLIEPVFLDDTEFKTPDELGIEFANSIVAYKRYPEINELNL